MPACLSRAVGLMILGAQLSLVLAAGTNAGCDGCSLWRGRMVRDGRPEGIVVMPVGVAMGYCRRVSVRAACNILTYKSSVEGSRRELLVSHEEINSKFLSLALEAFRPIFTFAVPSIFLGAA